MRTHAFVKLSFLSFRKEEYVVNRVKQLHCTDMIDKYFSIILNILKQAYSKTSID